MKSSLSALLLVLLALPAEVRADPTPPTAEEQVLQAAGVATDGPALLEFFRRRTVGDEVRNRARALVARLGDSSFHVREQASTELVTMGKAVVGLLREASRDADLEVARRAEECLRRIVEQDQGVKVPRAAARLLAVRKPAGAAEVLLAYLPGAEDEVAQAIHETLTALVQDNPQATALMRTALEDPQPARRAAAVAVLSRHPDVDHRAAVRKLLADPDLTVRLRTAQALIAVGERDAVPVLINLLGQLPYAQALEAEDFLCRLADEQTPANAGLGPDGSRQKECQAAWAAWWTANGATLDWKRLTAPPKPRGYTLLVLLDAGQALEIDAAKAVRWKVEDLAKPLDAQVLPGDRLLVAEYDGRRVTERNRLGQIIWQVEVEEPLVAQRLPNGHTFVVTPSQLLEVDRTGREIANYSRPSNEIVMKGTKLPDGDLACIMTINGETRFVRLNSAGKELATFRVQQRTSGGRVEVLANGNILVAEKDHNRVVEHDPTGKVVWQAELEQPIAAVRLANGHTLVTSYVPQVGAVELDASGKKVWEYTTDTKVTRAFRR